MKFAAPKIWTNFVLLLLIVIFLLSFFDPRLIFSQTTTTGGDTASHFTAAALYRDYLLRNLRITGWDYGNLAGYPLFQYYFPLPFILCALLSLVLPITISFKIITVLGIFALPFGAFYFLEKLGFRFPIPIIGALSTLPFLLVESQSIWGGNIPSTLSGEFAYSHGMALTLFYLGAFWSGIQTKRNIWLAALLLAATGFSHGCALLVSGIVPLFCVFQNSDTYERLKYYLKVNLLAFLTLAFWLVPWLLSQQYTSGYFSFRWRFGSVAELFPRVLLPLYGMALVSAVYAIFCFLKTKSADGRLLFLWFSVLSSLYLCGIAPLVGVVDARFVPFVQLFLSLIGAAFLGMLLQKTHVCWPYVIAAGLATFLWADHTSSVSRGWIKWNYEGFENKPSWPALRDAAAFLKGSFTDPRVAYEHSPQHDQFGSPRVFESLPYFSGRATLEGLWLQSSINSPFIYYLQSQISEVASCPLPEYHCSFLDLDRALPRLRLFNAGQVILRSDAAKKMARSSSGLTPEKSIGPLEIYRIEDNGGHYVSPLSFVPVLYTGADWKREAFQWYRNYQPDSVPVVIDPAALGEDKNHFARITASFPVSETGARQTSDRCQVEERLEQNRIQIHTSCIGHPLMIKMSYHPRWKVKGASKVYLVTPGFMLVFPQRPDVELRFGWVLADYLGAMLTCVAGAWAVAGWLASMRQKRTGAEIDLAPLYKPGVFARFSAASKFPFPHDSRLKIPLAVIFGTFALLAFFAGQREDSSTLFQKGQQYYAHQDFETAKRYFQQAAEREPESSAAIYARLHIGLCLYGQKRYADAVEIFQRIVDEFPESFYAPEAMYDIAFCLKTIGSSEYPKYLRKLIDQYPSSPWAGSARRQLNLQPG